MGTLTDAVIAGLQIREARRRTALMEQQHLAEQAQQQFEFQQRREDRMLAQADALSQYKQARRDKLAASLPDMLARLADQQKVLNGLRSQANSEALMMGGPSKL